MISFSMISDKVLSNPGRLNTGVITLILLIVITFCLFLYIVMLPKLDGN